MLRYKLSHLLLLPVLGSMAVPGVAATSFYCIATNGGAGGGGGATYIGTGFTIPAVGVCTPWSGFTKTGSTVLLTTTGTGCLSSDGEVLTVSVVNADPSYLGSGQVQADYIRLTRSHTTDPFGTGQDTGYFGGPAEPTACTSSLLHLSHTHD